MTATTASPLTGGCLCGAVRFELSARPHDIYHCHCSVCRKCQGALYPTYGMIARSGFRLLKGADSLSTYDSSPSLHRRFCGTCGAHVFADMDDHPDTVSFCVASLDDGADPGGREGRERHIFWESRSGWYEPGDALPRMVEFGD